jgi:hypothetical protein
MSVIVLAKGGQQLDPCTERRARLLLNAGRASVYRVDPFTIRMKDRTFEDSEVPQLRLSTESKSSSGKGGSTG